MLKLIVIDNNLASKLEVWRNRSSKIGKCSFVVFTGLLFNVLILVLITYNTMFFLPTIPNFITKLGTAFGRDSMPLLGSSEWSAKFEVVVGLCLFTGLVTLWTLPQFYASVRLRAATSPLLQCNPRRVKRYLHRWISTQFLYLMLELNIIILFTYKYLTSYSENMSMVTVSKHKFVVGGFLFCLGCSVVRMICFLVVLKFKCFLQKGTQRYGLKLK